MTTDRRAFMQAAVATMAWGNGVVWPLAATAQESQAPPPKKTTSFSFDRLVEEAGRLASQEFEPAEMELPESIADLTYSEYRDIWFKPEATIWANDPTSFRLDLFHPGFVYTDPVQIALVENGEVNDVPFSTDLFAYGHLVEAPEDADGLGFSGFRARYPINAPDAHQEFVVFQGASYFRAVARDQLYGLSARGLAVNTAEPEGEEFPAFRKFWIEKPPAGHDTLVAYALLDSPSVTGAYRFDITPGAETVIVVDARIFSRAEVEKIGLAPLTSMFMFNAMNRAGFDDYRRAVHDSDGLQMLTGAGEWIWRPLANPSELQISGFADDNPRGFGLMQRARRFEEFEDAEARYERRPSLWIEPIDDWGRGVVELVEIPTDREIHDNIVAYWRPAGNVPAGEPRHLAYRMRWTNMVLPPAELLYASASRAGLSFDQQRRYFAIDFRGRPDTGEIDPDAYQVEVSASRGEIANVVVHQARADGALRVSFELDPGSETLSELRLRLTKDGKPASETWLYRWTE